MGCLSDELFLCSAIAAADHVDRSNYIVNTYE